MDQKLLQLWLRAAKPLIQMEAELIIHVLFLIQVCRMHTYMEASM
jgi:hypothetical protein